MNVSQPHEADQGNGSIFEDLFYCEERIGKDTVPFTVIKIRTMVHGARNNIHQEILESKNKPSDDCRIIPARRWMRIGFDELPQIVNIAQGHMAVVHQKCVG